MEEIVEIIESGLPRGWQWIKLNEVAEVNPRIPKRDFISNDLEVQFLPMKLVEELNGMIHLTETKTYGEVKKGYTPFINGDVIFAKVTPCMENGKIAVVENLKNEIGFGSSEFHVLRSKGALLNKYVFYYLIQQRFRSEAENAMTGAVGLRRVPKQFLENSLLPIPPAEIQQQIVSKIEKLFSELDKSIEEIKTAQEQLKVYRQAVLKWAFEGKLTNENLKDGELPEGWKKFKLKDLSENIQYGYTESSSKKEIGPKFLRITDIQDNNVNWTEVPYCKIDEHSKSKYLLKEGDLVFARTGATVGKSFLIKGEIPEAVFASYLIRVRVNYAINEKYLSYFFHSNSYWAQITKGRVGIGQPNVNGTKLRQLQIIVAPINEQQQIVQEIESRLSVCDKIEKTITESLNQAEALRQSILKKSFEGKL